MKFQSDKFLHSPLLLISFILLLGYLFFPWFRPGIITYGDWGFRFFDPLNPAPVNYLWDVGSFGGFGILWSNLFWVEQAQNFFNGLLYEGATLYKVAPLITGDKLAFYFPYLIFLFLSTTVFSLKFLKTNLARSAFFLAFSLNTYLLVLAQGGLIALACSAALLPLIFSLFYQSLETGKLKWMLLTGLVFALSLAYDPRMAYLNLLVLGLFGVFWIFAKSDKGYEMGRLKSVMLSFLVMGIITTGWHANWILPSIFYKAPALPGDYGDPIWVYRLAGQTLLNGLTSFHAGFAPQLGLAVGQTPPLFFVLGILGILGIWLNRKKPLTLFFAFCFLIFAFLVKGSNPPLGGIYIWIFQHVPGFSMFRDSTKFFAPLGFALAYLIALTIEQITKGSKPQVKSQNLLVLFFFVILIPPVWTHSLGGTFISREVPKDYLTVKEFLEKQPEWFRTLWAPGANRFSYQSTLHPALSALNIANQKPFGQAFPGQTAWDALSFLWQANVDDLIDLAGIKYIFVPLLEDDATPAVNDNPINRAGLKEKLDSLNWLQSLDLGTSTILAYENKNFLPLVWVEGKEIEGLRVEGGEERGGWKVEREKTTASIINITNPTQYAVTINPTIQLSNHLTIRLVFSQTYDPGWVLRIGEQIIQPEKCYDLFNCFNLTGLENNNQPQEVEINYFPQKYVDWGIKISLVTIILSIAFCVGYTLLRVTP